MCVTLKACSTRLMSTRTLELTSFPLVGKWQPRQRTNQVQDDCSSVLCHFFPGCANFALKRTASDYEGQYGTEAANFVMNNFYVDDGLKSVSTPEAAISLIKKTKSLCQKGGFNLHEFTSNQKAMIGTIPHEDR